MDSTTKRHYEFFIKKPRIYIKDISITFQNIETELKYLSGSKVIAILKMTYFLSLARTVFMFSTENYKQLFVF